MPAVPPEPSECPWLLFLAISSSTPPPSGIKASVRGRNSFSGLCVSLFLPKRKCQKAVVEELVPVVHFIFIFIFLADSDGLAGDDSSLRLALDVLLNQGDGESDGRLRPNSLMKPCGNPRKVLITKNSGFQTDSICFSHLNCCLVLNYALACALGRERGRLGFLEIPLRR